MITEVVDSNSGAILFKKDQESKNLEYLMKEMTSMKKTISKLEKRVKELETSKKN